MSNQPLALSTIPPASPAEMDYGVAAIKPDARHDSKAAAPTPETKSETKPDPAQDIFAVAERLQDLAWTMLERGQEFSTCAQIEELAATILSASSLRDPANLRAQRLGEVLRYLEQRIHTMLDDGAETTLAEAPPPLDAIPRPAATPAHEAAPDIMAEIENELFASVPAPTGLPPAAHPAPQPPPGEPFAALRAMSDEERIALFT